MYIHKHIDTTYILCISGSASDLNSWPDGSVG